MDPNTEKNLPDEKKVDSGDDGRDDRSIEPPVRADSKEKNLPDETEVDSGDGDRDDRPIKLPVWADSRWMSIISIFCIGLLSGFGGGFLLGGTSIVLLQSVELLADNRQFMDKLDENTSILMAKNVSAIDKEESVYSSFNFNIVLITLTFGFVSSILSVAPGLCIGLSTYSLGIKKYGQAAKAKALGLAGPVCLMVTTATGYLLGLAFESFVSIFALNVLIYVLAVFLFLIIAFCFLYDSKVWNLILSCLNNTFFEHIASILGAVFTPVRLVLKANTCYLYLLFVHLFFIGIVGIIAVRQNVVFESQTLNVIDINVLQAVFVGVFVSQLWAVTMGSLSFVFWQRGGAFKVYAAAAGSGTTVLGVIRLAPPSLGPGPSIGVLMGVAGAVGVSLSAAGAATEKYGKVVDHCGLSGQLGVGVGAAVAAFLPTSKNGLPWWVMSLCAAIVPAADFVRMHKLPNTFFPKEK